MSRFLNTISLHNIGCFTGIFYNPRLHIKIDRKLPRSLNVQYAQSVSIRDAWWCTRLSYVAKTGVCNKSKVILFYKHSPFACLEDCVWNGKAVTKLCWFFVDSSKKFQQKQIFIKIVVLNKIISKFVCTRSFKMFPLLEFDICRYVHFIKMLIYFSLIFAECL